MAKRSLAQGLVDQGFIRGTTEFKRAYWKLKEQRRMERDPNYREKELKRFNADAPLELTVVEKPVYLIAEEALDQYLEGK